MHLRKLKKKCAKLAVAGCGCVLLLTLAVGIIALGSTTGIKNWVYGLAKRAWSSLPNQVQIPKEIKLPAELGLPESIKLPQLPNLFTLSPQEQILLGNEVAQKQGLEEESFFDAQIDLVGRRLAQALPADYQGPTELGGWAWKFRGLRTKDGAVNAIALPGGRIYLYDGLIKLTDGNPNQLAGIIGHEMAHVVKEHSAKQLRTEGLLQKASELVLENTGGEGEGSQSQIIKTLAARMGKQITQMQLSQFEEYQADSLGFQFISAANYDPAAFIDVLAKLNQLSLQRKGILNGVFITHPPTDRRIQEIQKLINRIGVESIAEADKISNALFTGEDESGTRVVSTVDLLRNLRHGRSAVCLKQNSAYQYRICGRT
jgi:Zn-dependent protease with chaperone function